MKRNFLLKLSLLANAALIAALGIIAARPTWNASASAKPLQQFRTADLSQMGLKDESDNDGSNLDFLCSQRRDDYIETGARFLELRLNLATHQSTLLTTVKETLTNSANASFTSLCADLTAAEQMPTAPEKLAQYQDLAVAANTVFSDVRPAFDQFYASLSANQQRRLDAMLNRQNR